MKAMLKLREGVEGESHVEVEGRGWGESHVEVEGRG